MLPSQFIEGIGQEYKPIEGPRIRRWLNRLERFSEDQLEQMFDHILMNSRYQPKLGDVLKAAQELGFLSKRSYEHPFQADSMGSHDLCGGMGLLRVFFDVTADEERRPHKRLLAVKPANWAPKVGEETPGEGAEGIVYEFLYRCPCDAGARQPKSVPLWKTSTVETF